MTNARLIFQRLQSRNPNPQGELQYRDPFTLLIAVVLSAQATDVSVNKATPVLFDVAPTPQAMLALGEDGLLPYIKTIGLYRSKGKNIIKLCQRLIDCYGGRVPQTCDELITLAGVGRKTANVVLNIAFGQPAIAVDTHVYRTSHRLGLSVGKTPEDVEKDLLAVVPQEYLMHAHHWLILHGRYVCLARKPKCHECILQDICPIGKSFSINLVQ